MNQPKKLTRSRNEKWLGGVCGGIAEYTGIDVTLIRVLVLVGTLVGFGSLVIAYVIGWILMPLAPNGWTGVIPADQPTPGAPPQPSE